MRASVSSTREPMKPESGPSSEQGLASAVNLAGAFDLEFTQTPLAKHASFSGSLVAEVSSLCISSVCLITLDFPTTKPRDSALRAVTKKVAEIHVRQTSLFDGGILILEEDHQEDAVPFSECETDTPVRFSNTFTTEDHLDFPNPSRQAPRKS
jgi:hypothetical protein